MGFWHTGYIEFHEGVGLSEFSFEPLPPKFPCVHCNEIYASSDELRKHRFESHPLRRPVMFVRGRELGAHPIRITQAIKAKEVTIDGCDKATINGREIVVSMLPQRLSHISSDVCRLTLTRADVSSDFTLDFRIALEEDMEGIEKEFERTALGHRLDIRAVDEFISGASRYKSAIGYCDGICAYLYGALAKERRPDSSLPYEAYVGKFSKAAEELANYDRPLARTIGSLIEFHFNHFGDAARLAHKARVGQAAKRYDAWLHGQPSVIDFETAVPVALVSRLETLVTDWGTEEIVRWAVQPLTGLRQQATELELFLNRDITEFDSVKIRVLLTETYAAAGDVANAVKHAKALRNLSALESWAEAIIRRNSGDHDEQH